MNKHYFFTTFSHSLIKIIVFIRTLKYSYLYILVFTDNKLLNCILFETWILKFGILVSVPNNENLPKPVFAGNL